MRRVLFLDVDGVLNSVLYLQQAENMNHAEPNWAPGMRYDPALMIDPTLVARLNAIIEGLDVDVVLSSSWRWAFSIEQMRSFLTRRGFAGRLVDFTPSIGLRHTEIATWLAAHPVDRFVILDDMKSAGDTMDEHMVYMPDGLEDEHVERARDILRGPGRAS